MISIKNWPNITIFERFLQYAGPNSFISKMGKWTVDDLSETMPQSMRLKQLVVDTNTKKLLRNKNLWRINKCGMKKLM